MYTLTFDEYVAARCGEYGEEYLEHYPVETLRRDYYRLFHNAPREAEIPLHVYDALPPAVQATLYKYNYSLPDRLRAREVAAREPFLRRLRAATARVAERLAKYRKKIASRPCGSLNQRDSRAYERAYIIYRELMSPYTPDERKVALMERVERWKN